MDIESQSCNQNSVNDLSNPSTLSTQVILVSSLADKLHRLPIKSFEHCIYKVPEKLRRVNEQAFTPRIVSIGPLHRGKTHLIAMEEYKLRCLNNYLERSTAEVDLKYLVDYAMKWEEAARRHYQDTSEISSKEFLEMILLDGVFIVELFLKNYFPQMRDENDEVFEKHWFSKDVLHDMMLLENQIPFFVSLDLFEFIKSSLSSDISFRHLARIYFKNVGNIGKIPARAYRFETRHLVEFIRGLHVSTISSDTPRFRGKFEYICSATELMEAGVEFAIGEESCLFEIKFSEGVLTIPQLTVNEWTETIFRNLIAFEDCDHRLKYITSYVMFISNLINTPKDVDLLIRRGIIKNFLRDSEQVSYLFNSIYKGTMTEDNNNFYFADICTYLNGYSRDFWHQWKATWFKWKVSLKRDYFKTPWSILSVIAAVLLLSLTIIQAVCSILQI